MDAPVRPFSSQFIVLSLGLVLGSAGQLQAMPRGFPEAAFMVPCKPEVSAFMVHEDSPETVQVFGTQVGRYQRGIRVYFHDRFVDEDAISVQGPHAFTVELPRAPQGGDNFFVRFVEPDGQEAGTPEQWVPRYMMADTSEHQVRRYRAMAISGEDSPAPVATQPEVKVEAEEDLFPFELEDIPETSERSSVSLEIVQATATATATSSSSPAPGRTPAASVPMPRALYAYIPGDARPASCPPPLMGGGFAPRATPSPSLPADAPQR